MRVTTDDHAQGALSPAGAAHAWRLVEAGILACFLLFGRGSASGQFLQLQGGSSSLLEANGGSVEIHGPGYNGWVGAGSLNGQFRMGAFAGTKWHGYELGAGDHIMPLQFSTDIFDSSHYFLGRGGSAEGRWERVSVFAFGGTTSTGFGAPFFRGSTSENAAGVLFLGMRLTPRLQAFSRNIISRRQTSINGLEWQALPWVKAAVSGGIGANQGYFASSVTAEHQWISAKLAYIAAGDAFRRVTVRTPVNTENDKENILITVRPRPFLDLTFGRFNFLQAPGPGSAAVRASLNEYLASVRGYGFNLGASLFQSQTMGTSSTGTSAFLRRDLTRRIQAGAYLYHSAPKMRPTLTSVVSTLREVISPRLSFVQLVTNTGGRTSASFGGNFISNWVSFGVDYQNIYSPFRTDAPFKQALLFHFHVQPFGSVQVNGASYVAPDGSVRYTTYGSTTLYHGQPLADMAPRFKLPKFIVSGQVLDQHDRPVLGAALRVCGDLVFSNSEGIFFVREKKSRPCEVTMEWGEFLIPGRFEVISITNTVTPTPEDQESLTVVKIRRRFASR